MELQGAQGKEQREPEPVGKCGEQYYLTGCGEPSTRLARNGSLYSYLGRE